MDLVLEASDYYLFDKLYALLLPKGGAVDTFFSESRILSALHSHADMLFAQTVETPFATFSNATVRPAAPLSAAVRRIGNVLGNYQNQNEIYGLKPVLFPATPEMHMSMFARSDLVREATTIFLITALFGWILYFSVAYLSYVTVFDRKIFNHPRYLKNQMSLEIRRAMTAIPIMVLLTQPFFLLELKGFSFLYLDVNEHTGGWSHVWRQIPQFILFTDCLIYFIHRFLHWPSVYKALHKPHHKWIVCTPFASHAFHPVDGWLQSLPYHLYPMVLPLHKVSYLFLFIFVNFWTVMIHDGQYMSNDPVVNGTACHTIHHLYFNYNYGQFTTLWDRLGGSYRRPDDSLFIKDVKVEENKKIWKDQVEKMEVIRNELEGKGDDRVYVEGEM